MVIKECGPGWDKIIDPLIELCQKQGVEIFQIKEKFGRLCFYVKYLEGQKNSLIDRAIANAEKESVRMCEICGEYGKIIDNHGWLRTLCNTCNTSPCNCMDCSINGEPTH